MTRIKCQSCRDEISLIVPFLEVRPNGFTAFLKRKDWLPKAFCSFRCLEEWAKREQRRERSELLDVIKRG